MQYDQDSIFVCTNPQCKNSKIFTQAKELKQHFRCLPEPCTLKELKEKIEHPDHESYKINESFDLSNID